MAVFFCVAGFAFLPANAHGQDHLSYNRERLEIQRNGMLVLSGWALTNLVIGGYGNFGTSGRTKYFHQMNAAWNLVNFSIGAFAWYQSIHADPAAFSFAQSVSEARSIENILLFNLGLDLGYIAAGGYIWERGIRKNSDRLLGYGPSLILQGGFLLVFDAILYGAHRSNNQQLFKLLENITVTGSTLSVSVPF